MNRDIQQGCTNYLYPKLQLAELRVPEAGPWTSFP